MVNEGFLILCLNPYCFIMFIFKVQETVKRTKFDHKKITVPIYITSLVSLGQGQRL